MSEAMGDMAQEPWLPWRGPDVSPAPEELAAAIAYLASDDASFVQGVILPVDGGRVAV